MEFYNWKKMIERNGNGHVHLLIKQMKLDIQVCKLSIEHAEYEINRAKKALSSE